MDDAKLQTASDQNSSTPPTLDQLATVSVSSASPSQPHPMHRVFIGSRGLRAGWRFLLYIGMWAGLFFVVFPALVRYLPLQGLLGIWQELIAELQFLASALLPALVMAAIEKRPFGAYGLPRRQAFGKLFWAGMLWGIATVTLLVFAIGGFGDFSLGTVALHGARVVKFAIFWGGYFTVVGFFEEFLLRGYSQFTLATGMGFWPAAVLLSVIFAVLHAGNPGETFIGLVAVSVFGLFLCLTLHRTGNLWFAVGFHAAFDWGESYLYSVRDSGTTITGHLLNSTFHGSRWITGGSVGPEGSLLVYVVIALAWFTFHRRYPKVNWRAE
jgi:membrane protease YdiL (CAAX protease family)